MTPSLGVSIRVVVGDIVGILNVDGDSEATVTIDEGSLLDASLGESDTEEGLSDGVMVGTADGT